MNPEYQKYLKSAHWLSKRKKALERANYECQICESQIDLHVHHRKYDNLGDEQNDDLIVVCEVCHTKHHREEKSLIYGDRELFIERIPTAEERRGGERKVGSGDFPEIFDLKNLTEANIKKIFQLKE